METDLLNLSKFYRIKFTTKTQISSSHEHYWESWNCKILHKLGFILNMQIICSESSSLEEAGTRDFC